MMLVIVACWLHVLIWSQVSGETDLVSKIVRREKVGKPAVRDEVRLLRYLLDEGIYDTAARPVKNQSHPVEITMGMALAQLIEMNEKDQLITLNGFFRFYWTDPYLVWDPSQYGGIDVIRIPSSRIWIPDIALYSSQDDERRAAELFTGSNARISFNGSISWMVPAIIKSSCKVNVKFFPFDQQKCNLKFGSWTHSGQAMVLSAQSESANLGQYIENEQWTLDGAVMREEKHYYACCPGVPFYDIVLTITITRKPMFALFYYVWPSLLLLLIGVMVFFLPAESGEKVSLGISVLLSLTVYQLLVSGVIPRTSDVIPVLGKFVGAAVFFLSFATVGAVVLVNFHYRGYRGEKVPSRIKRFILGHLAAILCIRQSVEARTNKADKRVEVEKNGLIITSDLEDEKAATPGEESLKCVTTPSTGSIQAEPQDRNSPDVECARDVKVAPSSDNIINNPIAAEMRTLVQQIQAIKHSLDDRQKMADSADDIKKDWDLVGVVLDRGFLILLFVAVFSMCLVVFLDRPDYD